MLLGHVGGRAVGAGDVPIQGSELNSALCTVFALHSNPGARDDKVTGAGDTPLVTDFFKNAGLVVFRVRHINRLPNDRPQVNTYF